MIFKPELVRLVMQGKKTATRRLANGAPCRYEPGNDYAVQPGRGKPAVGRIMVLDVDRQLLGDLTFKDALAEGFRTTADFARYWMLLHETGYQPNGATADELVERWLSRHGDSEVWAITFELARRIEVAVDDTPLYLHRRVHRGLTTDASNRALGEPEVLDDKLRHRSHTAASRAAKERDRANVRRAAALAAVVRAEAAAALDEGVDPAELEECIERQLRALRRRAA